MSSPLQYALTVGPLGFYLWVLGFWHSGSRPRVVSGLADFTLLAFGVGGVLAFGPFGDLLGKLIFGKPDWLDRMVLVSALGLWATLLAWKALYRTVVYHVNPEACSRGIEEVLNTSCGRFSRTMGGFEDREQGLGVRVDTSRRSGCVVVEAYGRNAEALIRQLRQGLRARLAGETRRPSWVAFMLYTASIGVVLVPMLNLFLTQPQARDALRVLLRRLGGG